MGYLHGINDAIKVTLFDVIKVAVERVSIPKMRRSKTVVEEVGQSEEVFDDTDFEEMEDDEEEPLVRRRPTGVVIGGESHRELEKESKGSRVALKLKSSSEDEIKDIFTDDESKGADKKEKADESKKAYAENAETDKDNEEKAKEEHVEDQVEMNKLEMLKQRPPLVNTIMTLIPKATTLSPKPQPPQTKRSKTKVLVKKYKKPASQVDTGELDSRVTRLVKTVNAMSIFNLPEAIDKSIKAHLKNILPKDVPDFGKIKLDKAANKSMPKYLTTPFDQVALYEFDQKDNML
ncbi:hypothetical protein Tco_1308922 [Tanacetum coccineum]